MLSCSTLAFTMENKVANRLAQETSPYLLQHAYNPVDWFPWGKEAFDRARSENKLVLISVGYSACHWCHVMEKESFEDPETAELMNKNFVCIKVDREEHPDVDQLYMLAVQLMTGQGGWPLNCFALSDKRPIFGGTYFPNSRWKEALRQLVDFYTQNPEQAEQYAEELTNGIKTVDVVDYKQEHTYDFGTVSDMYKAISGQFDRTDGGLGYAPKFPMPAHLEFLLSYHYNTNEKSALRQVELTLEKMAFGGIYDQIGGGFSRYAVDNIWKVPHFEKMLYDNAQLIKIYSEAYKHSPHKIYKDVVYESVAFLQDELLSPNGMYYAALDADSEGEEGKYYVWNKEELAQLLGKDFQLFSDYYNVNEKGLWEHGNYILLRNEEENSFAERHGVSIGELRERIRRCRLILQRIRSTRVRPGLDDKQIVSWNGLLITGLTEAYEAFEDKVFLEYAEKCALAVLKNCTSPDGGLFHVFTKGKPSIDGYLDDYAFLCEALIKLYECNFEVQWLERAALLIDICLQKFFDIKMQMFYYSASDHDSPVQRRVDTNDNVIPSSSAIMAKGLYQLGLLLGIPEYIGITKQMLSNVSDNMVKHPGAYMAWGSLLMEITRPFYTVAILGPEALSLRKALSNKYLPNTLICGSISPSALFILKDKYVDGKTFTYVCDEKTCHAPLEDLEAILQQIKPLV